MAIACVPRREELRSLVLNNSNLNSHRPQKQKQKQQQQQQKQQQQQQQQSSLWQNEAGSLAHAVGQLYQLVSGLGPDYTDPSSRTLTEAEKDSFDAKITSLLKRAFDRLGALEAAHRQDPYVINAAKYDKQDNSSSSSKILSFWTSAKDQAGRQRASHRQQLILALSSRLESVAKSHAQLHSKRTERRLARQNPHSTISTTTKVSSTTTTTNTTSSQINTNKSRTSASAAALDHPAPDLTITDPNQPDIDNVLSSQQAQQFQDEADALLQSAQQDLDSVHRLESTISDIAELHNSLAHHLSHQAQLSDQLYDDAFTTSDKLSAGNQQLIKARQHNRESRLFLAVFFVGAALTLLFLDRY